VVCAIFTPQSIKNFDKRNGIVRLLNESHEGRRQVDCGLRTLHNAREGVVLTAQIFEKGLPFFCW
jgi:hypothetical protein